MTAQKHAAPFVYVNHAALFAVHRTSGTRSNCAYSSSFAAIARRTFSADTSPRFRCHRGFAGATKRNQRLQSKMRRAGLHALISPAA